LASELVQDALTLKGVDAHYGRSHVLHGVSLQLRRGRLLALLGRNGAGKTTTMLAISGLLRASDGQIMADGRAIQGFAPEAIARLGVRLVPQGRRVFASLSVQENLIVAEQKRRIPCPWSIERVYASFPQLERRHRQRAGTLSGGEQQMLAIGRALMGNPDVLLLDEPSEGLAPLIGLEVAAAIATLKAEKLSIILVEQNFKLAMNLADDIVVLNAGKVVVSGTAEEFRAEPDSVTHHLGVF
jgi:branched-chain amino acid transport system ATP-binding protein